MENRRGANPPQRAPRRMERTARTGRRPRPSRRQRPALGAAATGRAPSRRPRRESERSARAGDGRGRRGGMEERAPDADQEGQEETTVEAGGETVGEAKWAATKELEPRFPGITAEAVTFEVLEEPGEDGGHARVRAEVDVEEWRRLAQE